MYKICLRGIKGSEFEEVFNPPPAEPGLRSWSRKNAAVDKCVENTLQMLKSGKIPQDAAQNTRLRIGEIHRDLDREKDDVKRLSLLKILADLHDQVYELTIGGKYGRIQLDT